MQEREVFTAEDAALEVERLQRPPSASIWSPLEGFSYKLIIPTTVYPPREDTDILAKRIIALGPGRGRKFLEIGSGSGALCVLASSMGWKVSGCDINPFAVAATKGNLSDNGFDGNIKEGGIGPERFPFEETFDLIIWNLPYIIPDEIDQVLGPMEEAALVDTDNRGLGNRLLRSITSNQLLATKGRILILGRENSITDTHYLAHRVWDNIEFENGEKLELSCYWRPFEGAKNIFVERTGSTNEDLLNKTGVGTHVSTNWQTAGRGRKKRNWTSIEGSYAGSWIVGEGTDINPGHLQLSGGLAVLNSLNQNELILKWPNDIMIDKRKVCGILAEGRTMENGTLVVLGFGLNLKTGNHDIDVEVATLDEIMKIEYEDFDIRLNCELASLIESLDDIPPIRYLEIRNQALAQIKRMGSPKYNGEIYTDFDLNENGELILGPHIVDDGEDVIWT
jgi:biotin-[acetyl-CoA-carboxylase] ligase BirA-like protein